jgi:cell division protein FtsQ
MNEKRGKIFGLFLFIILLCGMAYLVVYVSINKYKEEIKMIEITGNDLLSENDYLSFTKLDQISPIEDLTLPVVKDRFEKHPYILRADVQFDGVKTVKVHLTEKQMMAVVLSNSEPYLISDSFQILPLLPGTKFMDMPIISNVKESEKIKAFSHAYGDDVQQAFKIIGAARLTDEKIAQKLSEINLRNGGDIVLTFAGIKPPVIFGKGEEAKKMVYLDIIWDKILSEKKLLDESEYIDLRFAKEVYLGSSEKRAEG